MRSSSSGYSNPSQSLYFAPQRLLTPIKSVFRLNKKLRGLPVRSKIILGYILAVSIPVIGTCVGLTVGNRYQKAATQTLAITYQEKNYLNELQSEILRNRIAKELGPFVEEAKAFRQASERMQTRLDRIQNLVVQLEDGQTKSVIAFAPQLQNYKQTAYQFSHELEVLTELSTSGFSSSDRTEQRILELAKGEAFREFILFSEQVDIVSEALDKDLLEAQAELQKAELFRIEIMIGSLLASMGVASILAFFTSQAISRPLEVLTNVAQQVTREANADIRAPVLTKDEIGTLAIALNQLIEWIGIYTTELKDAQLHLIQAEKMSSVGQLVAGVAHEINNPVSFIHGNIQPIHRYIQDLLDVVHAYQSQYPSPPQPIQEILEDVDLEFLETDAEKLLKSMKVGSERIREIVLSLRNFSRLDESESKSVDVHEGIDNTLLILQHRLKGDGSRSGIEVVKSYGALPLVDCYPGQLNQVFMNLLVNAIDALEACHQPANAKEQPAKTLWISTQIVSEKRLQIAIADNGVGMSQKVRSQILDPFFTTKPIGQGTGLGLSISYQIITEQHKGQMTCESTPGKGTKFVIEIPMR